MKNHDNIKGYFILKTLPESIMKRMPPHRRFVQLHPSITKPCVEGFYAGSQLTTGRASPSIFKSGNLTLSETSEEQSDEVSGIRTALVSLISGCDYGETLFYAEPQTLIEHELLAEYLKPISSKCMIVTDDTASVREIYSGFWIEEIAVSDAGSLQQLHKLLICNF